MHATCCGTCPSPVCVKLKRGDVRMQIEVLGRKEKEMVGGRIGERGAGRGDGVRASKRTADSVFGTLG